MVANQGYRTGTHAPGRRDGGLAAAATHHLLLGHALSVAALRATLPAARVGIALNLHPIRAFGDGADEARAVTDAEQNRLFLDPVVHGRYPAAAREHMRPPAELIHDGDMELISAPIDFSASTTTRPTTWVWRRTGVWAPRSPRSTVVRA